MSSGDHVTDETLDRIRAIHDRGCDVCHYTVEGPCSLAIVLDELRYSRVLITRALQRIDCEGPSTDPCLRCQMTRTVRGYSQHTYPNGAVGPRTT